MTLTRLRAAARRLLGKHYATVVDVADRTVAAFGTAVVAQVLAANLLDVNPVQHLDQWQQVGLAGLVAAVSVVKSAIMLQITGSPALLSPTSRTLRARRDQPPVRHAVPVRRPRPYPRKAQR